MYKTSNDYQKIKRNNAKHNFKNISLITDSEIRIGEGSFEGRKSPEENSSFYNTQNSLYKRPIYSKIMKDDINEIISPRKSKNIALKLTKLDKKDISIQKPSIRSEILKIKL